MKPIILDMKDMSDSMEVYGTRPTPVFAGMIYCLCGLLVATIIWMCAFQIDVVVKSNGMVKSSVETATITCIPSGKVEEYNIKDGAYVEKGDLLFRLDSTELQQKKQSYMRELKTTKQILDILDAYLEELDGKDGALDVYADNPYYEQYVNRFHMVKQNCDLTGLENKEQKTQYAGSIENLNSSIRSGQVDVKQLNQMMKAVKNRVNSFKENETYYYSAVEEYLSTYHITESQYDSQISNIENSKDGKNEDYQKQIKELECEKEKALIGLEQQKVAEIEQSILSVQKNQKELKANKKLTQAQLRSLNNGKEKLSKEQIISTEKEAVFSDIKNYENKKIEYESSIESLRNSIKQCEVMAQCDGYLNITQESMAGDYLAGGTVVGSIVPESGHEYIVKIYLDNHDIGRVSEETKVKYEIPAFPSSKYGNIEGKITQISKDLKINKDSGEGYYDAEATIILPEGVELRQGMAVEAKIVAERKSIMTVLLEKLDLVHN